VILFMGGYMGIILIMVICRLEGFYLFNGG